VNIRALSLISNKYQNYDVELSFYIDENATQKNTLHFAGVILEFRYINPGGIRMKETRTLEYKFEFNCECIKEGTNGQDFL